MTSTGNLDPGLLDSHTMLFPKQGRGVVEVDFQRHTLHRGMAVFLSPGQFLNQLSGDLQVRSVSIEAEEVSKVTNSRYLFKHLVSPGYVEFSEQELRRKLFEDKFENPGYVVDNAVGKWIDLNPFRASQCEINLLFDLKEFIDAHFSEQPGVNAVAEALAQHSTYLSRLTKNKLASTVNRMLGQKLLNEARKQLIFTDKTTKEVAYDLGFTYPTYFNRFFRKYIGNSPGEFREAFSSLRPDHFITEFSNLLDTAFREHRFLSYYADELNMSVKSLAQKVKTSFGVGFQTLMNERLLSAARELIDAGESVTEIAYSLGFKEPNHFSAFFKKHTGFSPTQSLPE